MISITGGGARQRALVAFRLDIVTVGVQHEGRVIAGVVIAQARQAVMAAYGPLHGNAAA